MAYPVLPPRKVKWVKCVDKDLLKSKNLSENDLLRVSVVKPEKTPLPFKRGIPLKREFDYKDYQLKVLKWACQRERGYLSLQMGLGKTLLGISIVAADHRSKTPSLIVCPLNVLNEWVTKGFKKFFGTFYRFYVLHPSWSAKNTGPKVDDLCYDDLKDYDYILTSYEGVVSSYKKRDAHFWFVTSDPFGRPGLSPVTEEYLDHSQKGMSLIHSVKWAHVVFDEIHNCANHINVSAKACYKICSYKRWGLSGTKVRNNMEDLWFQLKILHLPFSNVPYKMQKRNDLEKVYKNKTDYIFEANYKIAKVVLPPLERVCEKISFDPEHEKIYKVGVGELRNAILSFDMDTSISYSHILEKLLRLRQISISPRIVYPEAPVGNKIKKMVQFLKDTDKKTIVMSSFVQGLELLGSELKKQGVSFTTLTGNVPVKKRGEVISDFENEKKILLANYRIAGVGLNLQFASQWISLEPWWNESVHSQGYQRIWRPGQTSPCKAIFFLCPGIETAIMTMAGEKCEISMGAEEEELDFRTISLNTEMIKKMLSRDF